MTSPDTTALAKRIDDLDAIAREYPDNLRMIIWTGECKTLVALSRWAIKAQSDLKKIAKPALGGKQQQQWAREALKSFPTIQ